MTPVIIYFETSSVSKWQKQTGPSWNKDFKPQPKTGKTFNHPKQRCISDLWFDLAMGCLIGHSVVALVMSCCLSVWIKCFPYMHWCTIYTINHHHYQRVTQLPPLIRVRIITRVIAWKMKKEMVQVSFFQNIYKTSQPKMSEMQIWGDADSVPPNLFLPLSLSLSSSLSRSLALVLFFKSIHNPNLPVLE